MNEIKRQKGPYSRPIDSLASDESAVFDRKKIDFSDTSDSRFFDNSTNKPRFGFEPQPIDDNLTTNVAGGVKIRVHGGWFKKLVKVFFIIIGILILFGVAFGGYLLYRVQQSGGKVFQGSVTDILTKEDPLATDEYGRTNLLVFGTSEDDADHSGALLADSIMVISIDSDTGAANTISIPRDFWVEYDYACSVGYAGKINASYVCGLQANSNDENLAGLYFAQIVGDVFGIDIQYYVSVNYSAIRGIVDALGGIDVDIQSDDPRGIYDAATKLNLSNGLQSLDGETALTLARARNSEGGYGLSRSNFDREINQQLIVNAIRAKAMESGTLTDINKVLGLLDVLGDNIRTNIKASEIRSVINLVEKISDDGMEPISISEGDSKLVTTGNQDGQSIVLPIAGLYEYGDINSYIQSVWSN